MKTQENLREPEGAVLFQCPYHDPTLNVCLASISAMALDPKKRSSRCCTEDYDNCAIFLSKILRKCRPFYFGKQIRELALK